MLKGRFAWDDWFSGLIAGFIGGGAGAFAGGVSTLIAAPAEVNFAHPWKVVQVMGGAFLINGLLNMMAYLHQNPVPQVKVVTTTQTVEQTSNPAAITVTTVEETKTGPVEK